MRAHYLIAALAIVACLPAYADPPRAPAAVDVEILPVEPESNESAVHRVLTNHIGERLQSTVEDREQGDEVWSEDNDAADEPEVAVPCALCLQTPPVRLVNPPLATAPRN